MTVYRPHEITVGCLCAPLPSPHLIVIRLGGFGRSDKYTERGRYISREKSLPGHVSDDLMTFLFFFLAEVHYTCAARGCLAIRGHTSKILQQTFYLIEDTAQPTIVGGVTDLGCWIEVSKQTHALRKVEQGRAGRRVVEK